MVLLCILLVLVAIRYIPPVQGLHLLHHLVVLEVLVRDHLRQQQLTGTFPPVVEINEVHVYLDRYVTMLEAGIRTSKTI